VQRWSWIWSREWLLSPWFLQALLWVNLLGTLYGYEWYRNQLTTTWRTQAEWLVIFVPDSPTASLFFTITIFFLLRDLSRRRKHAGAAARPSGAVRAAFRGWIEALSVITQVKYGIWAVAIIFWGASLGDELVWQEWMLVVSHTAMAVEALLYMRFYRNLTVLAAAGGALWTLTNDWIDYTFGVFPYLPQPLYAHLGEVQLFTISLSVLGIACAFIGVHISRKNRV